MAAELNSPYARESFASDFLVGRTVRGTFETIEYLSKKNVYVPTSRKKKYDNRAFLRDTGKTPKLGDWFKG
jgi:hypothetical protein